jgi:uncharacterized membrane protein YeaQ/YmgE (transglycosylase-associated protein family)
MRSFSPWLPRVYFLVALLIGTAMGALACLPEPRTDLPKAVTSIALGFIGSLIGWEASVLLGADDVGPLAQLFVSSVAAGALVSVYQATTSERPPLR